MKRLNFKAEEVEAKLLQCNGNTAAVARHFGCHRTTVQRYCDKRERLRLVMHDIRESMKDNAESALYSAVLKGEPYAVCFYLKCQAKDRGYVERSELTGANGEALIPPSFLEVRRASAPGERNGAPH